MTWELIIPAIAAGLALISLLFRYLMHDREKMKKIEFAVIRKQREIKKYQKEKDTKAMMVAQKEMMSMSMEKMKLTFRSSLVTLPLFLIVWWMILGPMLSVAPLVAGEVSQVGADIRNLDSSQQAIEATFVSDSISAVNNPTKTIELDDKGDEGDHLVLWWNVTASEQGSKSYKIEVKSLTLGETGEAQYDVKFVSLESLTPEFSPQGTQKILNDKIEITPLYQSKKINLFGIMIEWHLYYIITFIILTPLLYPLTNRLLWGHAKGVKHLEKLDNEKNQQLKE